jgi:hypothetical protein
MTNDPFEAAEPSAETNHLKKNLSIALQQMVLWQHFVDKLFSTVI